MRQLTPAFKRVASIVPALVLAACFGGGDGDSTVSQLPTQQPPQQPGQPNPSAPVKYAVGGNVTGLAANKQVTLKNNNSDPMTVSADGAFVFPTRVEQGTSFEATVSGQPAGQTCAVSGGSGVVTADVTTITVTCSVNQVAYIVNQGSNTVSQFTIGADGKLNPMSTASVPTGASPASLMISPSGKFAYVLNSGAATATVFPILADGALDAANAITAATGGIGPQAMDFSPDGAYAYVGHLDGALTTISLLTDGTFTPTKTFAGFGSAVSKVIVQPSGDALLMGFGGCVATMTVQSDKSIASSGYGLCTAGSVSQVAVSPDRRSFLTSYIGGTYVSVGAFNDPATDPDYLIGSWATASGGFSDIAFSASGSVVYGVSPNLSQVVYGAFQGAGRTLTTYPAAPASTGAGASSITLDMEKKFAYVINYSAQSVSRYRVAADEMLTPISVDALAGAAPVRVVTSYVPLH